MARRNDHTRDQIKDMILRASWTIVGKEGFEGLSARRVAADIGYVPGTIYNVFESMDDLYLEINGRTLDRLYDVLNGRACNDDRKTPAQNMKTMADLYMAFAREYRPYWLMLFAHRLPQDRKLENWYQQKIDKLFDPLEKLLKPFFSERQARKRKMAARILWASVHGLCFLQETGKMHIVKGSAPTEMTSYLIETFIRGTKKTA